MDNDDDKKLRRWYELVGQGDVFVETLWDEKFIKDKKMKGSQTFDGKIGGVTWTTKLNRLFARPTRRVISGLSVFMGSMIQYDMDDQPYAFTVDVKPYEETKASFGQWERWKYVTHDLRPIATATFGMVYNNWRLTTVEKDRCEIIRYQDPWNNG
jgi:hypothetical protein